MDRLKQQVARARRRLIAEQFAKIASWVLFTVLLVSAIGLLTTRLFGHDSPTWLWSWLGGGVGLGLAISFIWTYAVRRRPLDAAIEIDRRFGLKERVSSTLSLGADELATEAGQSLMADAMRRVERIEIAEQFRLGTHWRMAMPLVAAMVFAAVVFVPNPYANQQQANASTDPEAIKVQVQASAQQLRKKLAERQRELAEKGLADATEMLRKLEQETAKLQGEEADRKEAMIKINDMASELAERRKQLGGAENVRKQLDQLKDLPSGPADKMAEAMKEGDFKAAMQELEDLKSKLDDGEMSEQDQKALAEQLEKMRQKLEEMKQAHEQAKQDLQEQIEQRKQAGDLDGASKLQQQLDALSEGDSQMQKLGEMADKLGQAAEALQDAESGLASQSLQDTLDQLESMQAELDELEALDDLLDDLADAKSSMNCPNCKGAGCPHCQGQGQGQGDMQGNGNGLGEGQGYGERPEEATDTGAYSSRVRANLQKGGAVKVGEADGPNRAGRSRESVKEEIELSVGNGAEAVNDQQRLPRDTRDHVGEYFERLNQ